MKFVRNTDLPDERLSSLLILKCYDSDMKWTPRKIWLVLSAGTVLTYLLLNLAAFAMGQCDYRLILLGQSPRYAHEHATASDGGTTLYRGIGYELEDLHSMRAQDDVEGYIVGPRINYSPFLLLCRDRESLSFSPEAW